MPAHNSILRNNFGSTASWNEGSEYSEHLADDDLDEVVMAVNAGSNGLFGCSYFTAQEQKLSLMSDVRNGNFEILDCLKAQIQPTLILMPYRIPERVDAVFTPYPGGDPAHGDSIHLPYEIEYRHAADFSYDAATKKLSDIAFGHLKADFMVPGDYEELSNNEDARSIGFVPTRGQLLKISTVVDMDSRFSVGCGGAILSYIRRRKAVSPHTSKLLNEPRIARIEMFNVNNTMFVNADTIASLQILRAESSPNAHSQGPSNMSSNAKEGLSVYGLFQNFARTPQGGNLLRNLLSRPTLDLEIIYERQNTISVLIKADNEAALKDITRNLGFIRNMRAVLVHLKKGINNASSKATIRSSVWSNIRLIRDALTEINGADRLQLIRQIFEEFDTHTLALIGTRISNLVDFEASIENHRTVVKHGVNKDLDHMKRSYNGMEDMLNKISKDIASMIAHSIEINVIFFPQIGFLISIPIQTQSELAIFEQNVIEAQAWDRIFTSQDRAYYKDLRMRDLDETWGDVYASICDVEIEIIYELGQEILKYEDVLASASDLCGELDCLVALTRGARHYNLVRPTVTNDNVICIKGGRHPLQEHCVSSFVTNDAILCGGSGNESSMLASPSPSDAGMDATKSSMFMLTGPNFSGKSIYLKQVGIIVYMAHVGCFVPADQAVIGLTDAILTRVTARETVSKGQSAFMIDLQQVSLALASATRRSLIILDEIGKGTETNDGIGLACGVFRYLLSKGSHVPKVLASTHFHELFENNYLDRQSNLALGHMEVRKASQATDDQAQFVHLYNLRSGRAGSSYGNFCAFKNGIDANIVTRAEYLEDLSVRQEDLVATCSILTKTEEEDLQKAEVVARDFLELDLRNVASDGLTEQQISSTESQRILTSIQ